jgi:hypothetical protein
VNFAKLFAGPKHGKHARTAPFKLTWANQHDVEERGIGIELSMEYAVFGSEIEPRTDEVDLFLVIRERRVSARAEVEEKPRFVDGGKPWYRVRAKFLGVAADYYDLLLRELTGAPEPANKAFDELQAGAKEDNDYRLLPLDVQQGILNYLVQHRRLDSVVEGQLPAVRMRSLGKHRNVRGMFRKINITSRKHLNDGTVSYNTVFLIDDQHNVEVFSE